MEENMHSKCCLFVVLLLAGTAGCRLFQKKESVPEVTQTPASTIEEPVATPLPQEATAEPEPMREYPDDPRWGKIREIEANIAVLEAELAAAERELAEEKAQYEQSGLTRKPQETKSELGNASDTAERRLDRINHAVTGGER